MLPLALKHTSEYKKMALNTLALPMDQGIIQAFKFYYIKESFKIILDTEMWSESERYLVVKHFCHQLMYLLYTPITIKYDKI